MIGAAAIGVAVAAATGHSPVEAAAVGAAAVVTAKLPDVDRLVNDGPNHRSLPHSLIIAGGLVVALAVYASTRPEVAEAGILGMRLGSAVVLGLAVGYLSHLALDAITTAGIPLFLPGGPRLSLGLVRTGKLGEQVVVWILVAVAVVAAMASYGVSIL